MAQADSVPTAIPRPITGAISKASTNRGSADRLYLIGGSAPHIPPIETETSLLELWREVCRRADRDNPTEEQSRRWHETITGRIPLGWYIVAILYATVSILLGCWPWNILLILLLFSCSKYVQLSAINNAGGSNGRRRGGSCR
jgi:hypothetical protein